MASTVVRLPTRRLHSVSIVKIVWDAVRRSQGALQTSRTGPSINVLAMIAVAPVSPTSHLICLLSGAPYIVHIPSLRNARRALLYDHDAFRAPKKGAEHSKPFSSTLSPRLLRERPQLSGGAPTLSDCMQRDWGEASRPFRLGRCREAPGGGAKAALGLVGGGVQVEASSERERP